VSTTPLLLYLSQAAALLGMSESRLYSLTRARAQSRMANPIPHFKIGRRIAFTRSGLEEWICKLQLGHENKEPRGEPNQPPRKQMRVPK
jgi:predicted DNA-binding transcriptional regulator AlpA